MSESPYQRLFFNERQNFFETPSTRTNTSLSEWVASGEWLVVGCEFMSLHETRHRRLRQPNYFLHHGLST